MNLNQIIIVYQYFNITCISGGNLQFYANVRIGAALNNGFKSGISSLDSPSARVVLLHH